MDIFVNGLHSGYETEQLCRLFFPEKNIAIAKTDSAVEDSEEYASVELENGRCKTVLFVDGAMYSAEEEVTEGDMKEQELRCARILYGLLVKHTDFTPPWGILTGVRPIKLMRSLCDELGEEKAQERYRDILLVSPEKTGLAMRTYHNETPFLDMSRDDSFSLYISVPFCPTRCGYCSFVSQTVEKSAKLLPEYVDLLVKEIYCTAEIAKQLGLRLETVYMGGGTPTTFSAQQLQRVLGAVNDAFDISSLREFTVEAGRPDTVTPEKLKAIKEAGAGRISINPQTMDDAILERIGRRHTTQQTIDAFMLARAHGFDNINMDLIAGLPGDTPEGFASTLSQVTALDPEAVTVHTLALKRASNLVIEGNARYSAAGQSCVQMLETADRELTRHGYEPYYLYRQTRIVGNLENVGWSKKGCEGLYNIYIMDETHTILAVGAGGVTKLKQPGANNIERIFNHKFPYEYNSRFDEILSRKRGVIDFYEKLR